MISWFLFLFFLFGLKFAEWESIDGGEIIDRMIVEREAMTRESLDCGEIIDWMEVEPGR